MKRFALAVVFVLLIAGCGGDDDSSDSSDAGTTTAQCERPAGASVLKKVSPVVQDRPTMYLTDVEIEVEDCVERVIFKFEEDEPGPGYDVSFQPPEVAKVEDGSGDPLAI